MITYELVIKPLLLALLFFLIAIIYFLWLKAKIKQTSHPVKSKFSASLVGWSMCVLGGFCLFISLFFLIAG